MRKYGKNLKGKMQGANISKQFILKHFSSYNQLFTAEISKASRDHHKLFARQLFLHTKNQALFVEVSMNLNFQIAFLKFIAVNTQRVLKDNDILLLTDNRRNGLLCDVFLYPKKVTPKQWLERQHLRSQIAPNQNLKQKKWAHDIKSMLKKGMAE